MYEEAFPVAVGAEFDALVCGSGLYLGLGTGDGAPMGIKPGGS